MKNFTQARIFSFSVCLFLIALLFATSCTSPQHFSFTAAPPAYQKVKKETIEPAVTETEIEEAPATTLSASTENEPVVLPEIANLTQTKAQKVVAAAKAENKTTQVATKQKLTLAQKVVLKKLQKQVTKLTTKNKNTRDISAGPTSNRSAIALILIGLVVALIGGLISNLLATLGVLIVLIGLILLILNYI